MAPPLDDATHTEARLLLRAAATPTAPAGARRAAPTAAAAAAASEPAGAPLRSPMAPPGRRIAISDQISGRLVAIMSVAWVCAFVVQAIQPPPDDPHVALPAWAVGVNTVHVVALLATIVGFAVSQRWALLASATAAASWAVGVIACPLVSHHETVGLAWGVALVTSLGIAVASALAFARASRRA